MERIPVTSDPHQIIETVVGGQAIILDLSWSPLLETWRISVQFADGIQVTSGRQVAAHELLISSFGTLQGFVGNLIVAGADGELGRQGWTTGFGLYYLEPEEVPDSRWR